MIRILHVVSNLSSRSGIMSYLINYHRMLPSEECSFSYMYTDERKDSFIEEIKGLGGHVYKVKTPKNLRQFYSDYKTLGKEIHSQYDIVEIHDPFFISFMYNIKKVFGAKIIISHAHSLRFADTKKGELRNRVLSLPNYWIPDYYFACSIEAGHALFGSRFFQRGEVINNAINLSNFCQNNNDRIKARNEFDIDNEIVYGHVGNFVDPKNHSFLIDIFFEITLLQPNSILLLVGDGPLRGTIERRIKELKLEHKVKLLGARNDVSHVLRAMDCFIFPSKFEGLGISCIEAQAVGLPCIISDNVPSVANIIMEKNAVLSINDDKKKWAITAVKINKSLEENALSMVSEQGFNIAVEAKKLLIYYRKLILK